MFKTYLHQIQSLLLHRARLSNLTDTYFKLLFFIQPSLNLAVSLLYFINKNTIVLIFTVFNNSIFA